MPVGHVGGHVHVQVQHVYMCMHTYVALGRWDHCTLTHTLTLTLTHTHTLTLTLTLPDF